MTSSQPPLERASWPTWIVPALLVIFSSCLAWLVSGGVGQNFRVPLIYGSDGLLVLQTIKRVTETWYFHSGLLGYPFGAEMYDYPASDMGAFLLLKLLGLGTHSIAVAFNAYYLLGFPVAAVTAYIVLLRFELPRLQSAVGALLFAFTPFHMLRLAHLYYTWYFMVPLFIWYAWDLTRERPSLMVVHTTVARIWQALLLLIIASFGVYYTVFGIMLLLAGGVWGSLRWRVSGNLVAAVSMTVVLAVGVGANIAPNLWHRATVGGNVEVAQRSPAETENYGLKLSQLLLPQPEHRARALAEVTRKYNTEFPLSNENRSSALGTLGAIGLLLLLGVTLFGPIFKHVDPRLRILAFLTLVLLLWAQMGGFSSLFSLLVSPLVRAWNRASIYIAFMALAALMLVWQRATVRWSWSGTWPVAMILLVFGLWDQTSSHHSDTEAQRAYASDREFVRQIETAVGEDAAVYQLPYMAFPEVPPVNGLQDYGLGRGYLHSHTLKWSYGGMKGREGDLFFRALSRQSIATQRDVIAKLGFGGIYIDRRGYADHGVAVEREIASLLNGVAPMTSADGQLAFFRLSPSGPVLAPGTTVSTAMEMTGFAPDVTCLAPTCLAWHGRYDTELPHLVGRFDRQGMVSDGRPGFLAFGPGKAMSAGEYQLTVRGSLEPAGAAKVDMVAEDGRRVLLEVTALKAGSGILLQQPVKFAQGVNGLQVRVQVDGQARAVIESYTLKPLR